MMLRISSCTYGASVYHLWINVCSNPWPTVFTGLTLLSGLDLCIPDTSSLWFAKIPFHWVGCLSTLLMVLFEARFLILMMSKLSILFLIACCFERDFPCGISGKEPTCQCRRLQRHGFDPWVGKIPQRRAWQPTPVFLPGKSHGQRSLKGYSPWG